MPAAKPITLTRAATNPAPNKAPEPLLIVGALPATALPNATTAARGAVLQSTAITDLAAVGTLADLAAAQTAMNTIVTKINALLAAQRTAGQILP